MYLVLNSAVRVGLRSRHNHVFVKKVILFRLKGDLATITTYSGPIAGIMTPVYR